MSDRAGLAALLGCWTRRGTGPRSSPRPRRRRSGTSSSDLGKQFSPAPNLARLRQAVVRPGLSSAVSAQRPAGRAVFLHARPDARPLRRRTALARIGAGQAVRPRAVRGSHSRGVQPEPAGLHQPSGGAGSSRGTTWTCSTPGRARSTPRSPTASCSERSGRREHSTATRLGRPPRVHRHS